MKIASEIWTLLLRPSFARTFIFTFTNLYFLKNLWYSVGGKVKYENLVLSTLLIKVELPL